MDKKTDINVHFELMNTVSLNTFALILNIFSLCTYRKNPTLSITRKKCEFETLSVKLRQ